MNLKLITPLLLAASLNAPADVTTLTIDAGKPGAKIQPTMYGLFFEDINHAADGGLYAEMVKNRSFEFSDPLMGWQTMGNVKVKDGGPFDRNPHYVSLMPPKHGAMRTGLVNEGFFGVAFRKGEEYRFSVWARADKGDSKITVELADPSTQKEKQTFASGQIEISGAEWKKYTLTLTPSETAADGRLRIFLDSSSGCDLEHISLFPAETFRGRDNGLRKDLCELLADAKPGVFRFPGGCVIEGTTLDDRYQWKNTIGPVENRPTNINRWQYAMGNRLFPDYYQSLGLGFFEYFQLCEDIGAEPLPVLNCGMLCQFQNRDPKSHVPLDSLQPYVQDALDLIEFANGPADSEWGAKRAEMGHPEPFKLKYIAIGNEQWGEEFPVRFKPFMDAIKKQYPKIKVVGNCGPSPSGDGFHYLWDEMKKAKADLVDEHYYANEQFFLDNATRYDSYDRKGPKVFAGEYACHAKGKKFNHFNAALMEAALMTGFERNADVVHLATYAPLFAHVKGWQWRPDMIWFDGLNSVPTSSYYVQQMFASNKGSRVLPLTIDGKPATGAEGQNGIFATAAIDDRNSGSYIIKVVNTSDQPQQLALDFKGIDKRTLTECTAVSLHSDNPDADNIDGFTLRVQPQTSSFAVNGNNIDVTIPAKTFTVYTFESEDTALENRTVDGVNTGIEEDEKAHRLVARLSDTDERHGEIWRNAREKGSFAYRLKTDGEENLNLILRCHGNKKLEERLIIHIDGKKLVPEVVGAERFGEFVDREFSIPAKMLKGKKDVEVRITGNPGAASDFIYYVRLVRPE